MTTEAKLLVNVSSDDDSYLTSPSNFIEVDLDNDRFVLCNETSNVKDNIVEPSEHEFDKAALLIQPESEIIVPHCFIIDRSNSGHELQEIYNFNKNKRYTFCIRFDNDTLDIPELQLWDNELVNTTQLHCLGNGDPTQSWMYAILTTGGLPGASWVGTRISGQTGLQLSAAPLGSGVNYVYFNLRGTIPTNYPFADREEFRLVVRYKTQ
ncbi:MAG: hypothetical protein ACFFAU_01265 [Candidatus Hodarchaeota archaeon]